MEELISPLRIDFAGGWIDVPDFHDTIPGYVVNVAISPHIRYFDGRTDFSPYLVPGGGISSSTGALILGVLEKLTAYSKDHKILGAPQEFAEMIFYGENVMLEYRIGRQDQYAIALGGLNCLRFGADGFHVHNFEVERHVSQKDKKLRDLEKKLLLVHSGILRPAQDLVSIVRRNFLSKQKKYLDALRDIAECGTRAAEAVRKERYPDLADIMSQNWDAQKRFACEATNKTIDRIYAEILKNGAIGGKMCGAGGGGYFVFYCEDKDAVKKKAEKLGLQTIEPVFEMRDILTLNNLNYAK